MSRAVVVMERSLNPNDEDRSLSTIQAALNRQTRERERIVCLSITSFIARLADLQIRIHSRCLGAKHSDHLAEKSRLIAFGL